VIPLLASEKYFHAALQPYLRKISVVSRISAVFFTYRNNSAKPNISRIFFPAIRILKKFGLGSKILV